MVNDSNNGPTTNCANCGQAVYGEGYTRISAGGAKFCCQACADEYVARHPVMAKVHCCIAILFLIGIAIVLIAILR